MREILGFAGNAIVAYQAQQLNRNSVSVVVASLLSNPIVIAGAALVVAAIILVAALLLFRSSGKKKKANAAASSDWQRQGQQVPPPGWNQQGSLPGANAWGQPGQSPNAWGAQQHPSVWGAQSQTPQQQTPGWGQMPAQQPATWDAQSAAQQQPSGWGAQNPAPQQPAAWNTSSAASSGGQQQWDAPSSSPDAWAQPQQGAPPWGQQSNQPSAPTAYGNSGGSGQSWSQPAQVADQWGQPVQQAQQGAWTPGVQQAPPTTPPGGNVPWQQQGPVQAQQGFGASPFDSPDGDRTMLRSTGGSQGIGTVRIEEGKEPGRVYEIRKESLSIGRSRESDIFLEDLAVSRLHASIISLGNNSYALRDEGSANGTKVNGQPVNKYQPYPLQEGDKIQLGQTVLVFGRR
jgi:hypothetical protein